MSTEHASPKIWRYSKYRGNDVCCPLCYEPICWIKDRERDRWVMCDEKPYLYITDDTGVKVSMYTRFRKPIDGILFNSWDKRFSDPTRVKQGFVPHIYVCEVLNGGT